MSTTLSPPTPDSWQCSAQAKKLLSKLGAVKVTVHLGAYNAYTPKTVPYLHLV